MADITPERWDHILGVNLTGTFVCMQLAVADMLAEGWGRIVTISSSSAQSGAPHMAHYVASKGGVIGLTKAFAREFAAKGSRSTPSRRRSSTRRWPGRPGSGASSRASTSSGPMVPLGRAATPDDIAATAAFLCSEDASYITGQIIGVNGGMYI